jgi:hypothetical protein
MAKKLTIESSMADFRRAYRAKTKLMAREKEDFLFALGQQWDQKDVDTLQKAGIKAITDNRIAPNIFLLTGLERQNRSDFKAFPEGEEDSVKAEIASSLFKNAIKQSEFSYKSSDQFKDGITCGESHLELYLDYTENLLNGKPCWRKLDGNVLFPEPGFSEYDFRDCRYVYKVLLDISKEDLINLYPEKKAKIQAAITGRLELEGMGEGTEGQTQRRGYPKDGTSSDSGEMDQDGVDLVQRYYKKWVETVYIGDKETGTLQESEDRDKAEAFIGNYQNQIVADQQAFQVAAQQAQVAQSMGQPSQAPPPPPERNPDRFIMIKRMVPEIWCFAHAPGIEEPLCDERAWFYPKWKLYPFVPYFARFSTAPLKGDDSHLLVQGIVHAVKGVQEKHNKAEMLMLRHLNQSANSGWLVEEGTWVDPTKVENAGSVPGVNLEYNTGKQKPERLFPMNLSPGHAALAAESAEAIKAQLGINADLLASQEGGGDSGRAIALRQRQGLLMVQELFDNLSRSRIIAGKFLLSQLGEIYDTETAKKVLGEAFLQKTFPPLMVLQDDPQTGQPMIDPMTGQPKQVPMTDPKTGQPMSYDTEMAEVAIAEVLGGELGKYDVAVGEAVSSETQKMANSAEVKEIATAYPGLIPPQILIEESQLPQSTKNKIMSAVKQQELLQQKAVPTVVKPPPGKAEAA